MINFLKKLFGFAIKEKQKAHPIRVRDYAQDHDMIDYDGMGNQGRFPTHK